jgi:ferredoxin
MTTRIYYFTGTGNSLWAARTLAERLGAAAPTPIVRALRDGDTSPTQDRVGVVVPVYMYRLPHLVVEFLQRLETKAPVFVVVTAGGDPGDVFAHVQRQLAQRGLDLAQGLTVTVQSNYIPFGGAPEPQEVEERLAAAVERLEELAGIIERGERVVHSEHDRFRAWVHPGLLYRLGYRFVAVTDKSYLVEDSCNGCGLCARICPVDNLTMVADRPTWNNACEQCMACLQWCPKEAIQVKGKTKGQRRYHHPDIGPKDLMDQKA